MSFIYLLSKQLRLRLNELRREENENNYYRKDFNDFGDNGGGTHIHMLIHTHTHTYTYSCIHILTLIHT